MLKEGGWRSDLFDSVLEVWLNFVHESGHVREVSDAVIFPVGDRQGASGIGITHCHD